MSTITVARRQVFGDGRRLLEEERQPGLDAGRGEPLASPRDRRGLPAGRPRSARASGCGMRPRPRAWSEIRAPAAGGRCRDARPSAGRPDRSADALDLVIEQVEPEGLGRARGEEVEDRSAHGEFPGTQDLRDMRIAGAGQARAQASQVDALAGPELEGMCVDESSRRQPVEQRRPGRDDQAALELRQRGERAQALRNDVRMRREGVVGQGFAVRKGQQRSGPWPAKNASSASIRSASRPVGATTSIGSAMLARLRPAPRPGCCHRVRPSGWPRRPSAARSCRRFRSSSSPQAEHPVPGVPGGVRERRIPAPEPAASRPASRLSHDNGVQNAVILEVHGKLRHSPSA